MSEATLIDLPLFGEALRDAGTEQALQNAGSEWQDKCISVVRYVYSGKEATGEDFRHSCEAFNLHAHHPNAWGALTLSMKRKGFLKETGEWRKPNDSRSHARPTRVYIVS
jgi:hypothetical protein